MAHKPLVERGPDLFRGALSHDEIEVAIVVALSELFAKGAGFVRVAP